MLLGIDEVGRGPWAGPLVVGAVVLGEHTIEGLTDSKKLSPKKRAALDVLIREQALSYGLGWVHADELDRIGLAAALRVATIRAVEKITVPYHEIIIDGTINFLSETTKGKYVTTLPKADLLVPSVSAASIIAKVARDSYMAQQDEIHPGYSFTSHVGYGTATHRRAIDLLGITPLHRKSFAPIAKAIVATSTTAIGNQAEEAVVVSLSQDGWVIAERNWKTKYCEIDIVAVKDRYIAFVEVKHRRTPSAGDGLAAITAKKLQQMRFAAELYMAQSATSADLQPLLMAASTSGASPVVDELLEID